MNPNWTDANSWIDILDHIWIGLVLLAAAAVPSILTMRNHKTLSSVHQEVKNSHASNLRDDLDRAIAGIEALAHDVRGLRTDIATEEDRRRQQVAELRADLEHRTGRRP